MRGKILEAHAGGLGWSCETIEQRALYQVGNKATHYHLAYPNGGADPLADFPHDKQTGGCDCIGFACWAAGFDRYQPGKFPLFDGYINTDSMIEEAKGQGKWFRILKEPNPGCFIVGHSFFSKTKLRRVIGHIGVVTDCSEYATRGLAGIHVVHCSPSNVNRPGNVNHSAVWKTDGTIWSGYPEHYFIELNRDYATSVKAA